MRRCLEASAALTPGNPVACAAALAVLDIFETDGIVERAAAIGATLRTRLLTLQDATPSIGDVRGLGCMLAIELVVDRGTAATRRGAGRPHRRQRPPAGSAPAEGRPVQERGQAPSAAHLHRQGDRRRSAEARGGRSRQPGVRTEMSDYNVFAFCFPTTSGWRAASTCPRRTRPRACITASERSR